MEEKEKSPGRGPGEDTARDTVRAALRAYETFAEPRDWEEIAAAQREWREYWEADSGPDQDDSRDEKEKFAEMFRRTFSPFARLWNPKAKWGNYNAEERSKWYKYMYEAARRTADDPEAENCIKQYFRELYRNRCKRNGMKCSGRKGKRKGNMNSSEQISETG